MNSFWCAVQFCGLASLPPNQKMAMSGTSAIGAGRCGQYGLSPLRRTVVPLTPKFLTWKAAPNERPSSSGKWSPAVEPSPDVVLAPTQATFMTAEAVDDHQ